MDRERTKMREFMYSLIDVTPAMRILDMGCGVGYDLGRIASMVDEDSYLCGVDESLGLVEQAERRYHGDKRFRFVHSDVRHPNLLTNDRFDLVLSSNILECIPDKQGILRTMHDFLKPGGQVICAHFDWDSQLFDGFDKDLVRRVVRTYNDWQQPWMDDVDSWMGRRLWRTFRQSGLFCDGRMETYVLTNTEFCEPYYGYMRAKDFEALVHRGKLSRQEYQKFWRGLEKLAEDDQYFYSITMYIYVGRRPY